MKKQHLILLISSVIIICFSGCGLIANGVGRFIPQDGSNAKIIMSKNFNCKLQRRIAILPLKVSGPDVPDGTAEQATSSISHHLMSAGFTVIEGTQPTNNSFDELKLEPSGTFSSNELNKVGNQQHIDMIVDGTGIVNNQRADENLRFIDVKTGEVLIQASCYGSLTHMAGRSLAKEIGLALKKQLDACQ